MRQIYKRDKRVSFGTYGGVSLNLETGEQMHCGVEDNIYTMSLWVPPPPGEDFSKTGISNRSARRVEIPNPVRPMITSSVVTPREVQGAAGGG